MQRFLSQTAAFWLVMSASTVQADGLIQSLPADGAWVRFNFHMTREAATRVEKSGELTVKSVGQEQHAGRPHRWIEIVLSSHDRMGGGERREVEKFLVPEAELTRDGSPMSHVVRGWMKIDDQDVVARNPNLGPGDSVWMPGAEEVRETVRAPREIEYQRGRLSLDEGLRGRVACTSESGVLQTTELQVWTTDHVPFGVGASEHVLTLRKGETDFGTYRYLLEMNDYGTGAVSTLPGHQ
jgi:hypothetical protein